MFDVWGRLAETGNGNKSRLVAFESTRLEQRRGMLTFDEIMKFVVITRRIFPIDIGCVRRFASRRVAETGSRNRWPLVAFKSARLEQLGDLLTFLKV